MTCLKIKPMHVALVVASLLYLIAGTASAKPLAIPNAPAMPSVVFADQDVVVETEADTGNYMATVAKSTFFGAITGVMIGGAIYYLNRPDSRPVDVGYWTAGGALLGAGVGLVQVMVQESRVNDAMTERNSDPDPAETVRLSLYDFQF